MSLDTAELFARLRQHRTLGSAPEAELQWLIAHGHVRDLTVGEIIVSPGGMVHELAIVLSGRFAIYVDRGAGARKVMEWHGGDVAGALPYSRMSGAPGATVVEEETTALMVPAEHFPEMTRECPVATAAMVHVMLDRARTFSSSDWQDEKMVSLGKLAAGLAHELNNPSSAAASSSKQLALALNESERAARVIAGLCLSQAQLDAIDAVHEACLASVSQMFRTPIQRSDREEQFSAWLEEHGVDPMAAAALSDTAAEVETLDILGAVMSAPALDAAIRWIGAGCQTRSLVTEVNRAAMRVNDLVSAIKRHTYMDRPGAPESVDLGQGIMDAITVAGSKARRKGVTVVLDLEPDLPAVWGNGGELNQVWSNLLDNAIDAAGSPGHVDVSVRREVQWVVVHFVDNGAGIPPEVQKRMFDAFFTTKPVGQGTGLGLDIAQRIVRRYNGSIEVDSHPGRTEFRVRFPVPGASHAPVADASGNS